MVKRILIVSSTVLFLLGIYVGMGQVRAQQEGVDLTKVALITNRDSHDLSLIDLETDQVIGRVSVGIGASPHMAMVTHGGDRIVASATGLNEMVIIDGKNLKELRRIPVGKGPEHFDLSGDDRWLYVGNLDDGTVSVIDLDRLQETQRISGFFEPHGATIDSSKGKVYIPNFGAHEVGVLDIKSQRLFTRVGVGGSFRYAALDPARYLAEVKGVANVTLTVDGRFGYLADGDSNSVAILDTQNDQIIKQIKVGVEPWRAYASMDGRWMLVPNNGDKTVAVIRTSDHQLVTQLRGGEGMTGINFALGGKKAFCISSNESAVYVYDLDKMKVIDRIKLGQNLRLETASTTSDGKRIYLTCSTNNSVYVIDAQTHRILRIPEVGQAPWGVAIHDGQNYCH